MSKNIGSDFDDFFHDEGIYDAVTVAALKRVEAWQLSQGIPSRAVTEIAVAAEITAATVPRKV